MSVAKIQVYSRYGTPKADPYVHTHQSDASGGQLNAGLVFNAGVLQIDYGGTGINMSATGGAGQFLKQTLLGNTVTVATIDASEVPNLAASKITSGTFDIARIPAFPYARYEEQQAKNTGGGTPSGSAWNTRVLNTEVEDANSIASISSNIITLAAAGTYYFRASAPAYQSSTHKLILYNNTDSAVALRGTSEFANSTDTTVTRATVQGHVTIAATKAFTLRHWFSASNAGGLGIATNVNDPNAATLIEIYSVVEIWKVG